MIGKLSQPIQHEGKTKKHATFVLCKRRVGVFGLGEVDGMNFSFLFPKKVYGGVLCGSFSPAPSMEASVSHKFLVVVWMIKSFWVDVDFVANPPSRKKVRGKKFMWKASVRKVGPNVRQPTDPQSVILNLFQDPQEGRK